MRTTATQALRSLRRLAIATQRRRGRSTIRTVEVPKEIPIETVVEKEVVKEVPVEKIVTEIKEVVKEVPVNKVQIQEVPREVVRKEIVYMPVPTNDPRQMSTPPSPLPPFDGSLPQLPETSDSVDFTKVQGDA